MAEKFQPKTFDINSINNGDRYNLSDGISNETINAPIEASAYAQALATNQPNIENIDGTGTPSVSIEEVNGLPRFKFENLIGQTTPILSIIATFDITGNHLKTVSLQNLDGMTSIDWGDGTVDSNLTHRYATEGEYTCKIYGVKSIGENAFKGQDNAIYDNLKKITILDGITEIGASAFSQNKLLISIDLPNGLKSIADSAFIGCEPLQMVIPNSVVSIGNSAFGYCGTMKTVIVHSATPPVLQKLDTGGYAFHHCGSLAKIIVPIESLETYKTADGWRDYATLICSNICSSNKLKVLYCTNADGKQSTISYINGMVANAIVQRNDDGTIQTPSSSGDYHAVNNLRMKSYVNEVIGDINTALEAILGV